RGLPNLFAVVESDHHHDKLWLLCRNHLTRSLWPIGIFTAPIVVQIRAYQSRIGAMPPQHKNVWRVGVSKLHAIGEPVRHRVSNHHDSGGSPNLLLQIRRLGRRRLRVILRRPFRMPSRPIEGAAPLRWKAIIKELSIGGDRKEANRTHRKK